MMFLEMATSTTNLQATLGSTCAHQPFSSNKEDPVRVRVRLCACVRCAMSLVGGLEVMLDAS